jgi:hypothetical protein
MEVFENGLTLNNTNDLVSIFENESTENVPVTGTNRSRNPKLLNKGDFFVSSNAEEHSCMVADW